MATGEAGEFSVLRLRTVVDCGEERFYSQLDHRDDVISVGEGEL